MRKRRKRKSRYHTGIHVSLKCIDPVHFRSGWESAYCKWLDENESVECYTYERVVVPYISNVRSGRIRRYFVDFFVTYVDGHRDLVEIKPARKLTQKTVIKKLESAQRWCIDNGCTFSVITEIELKLLGCL